MSRILTTFVIAITALGVVVAIVRGQDRGANASREQSVLKRSGSSSEESSTSASSRRRSSYSAPVADRLKAIRDSARHAAGDSSQAPTAAPIPAPNRSRYADEVESPNKSARPITPVRPEELDEENGSSTLLPVTEPSAASNYAPVVSAEDLESADEGVPVVSPQDFDKRRSSRRLYPEDASSEGSAADTKQGPPVASRSGRRQRTPRGSISLGGLSPTLRVEVIGPDAIDIDREGAYEVTIANPGASDAQDVAVDLVVPKHVEVIGSTSSAGSLERGAANQEESRWIWTIARLETGEQERLQLKLIPRVKRPFQLATSWTSRPVRAQASIDVRQAQLQMVVNGPTEVLYGETAPYVVRLSNPGTGDAEDVSVRISTGSEPAQSRPIGTIAAGGTREIRFELTAREAGTMQITAEATATGELKSEVLHRIHIRRAKLELAVTGPKYKFAGTPSTYTVVVSNTGDAPAKEVKAVIQLPAGGKYLSGIEGAEWNDNRLAWKIADVDAGDQRTFQFQLEHGLAGDNLLQALVQAAGDLRGAERFSTEVEALADLKLVIHDPKGPRAVKEEAIYEIHVINRGTKAAEGVRVIAQFSDGIEPVRAEGGRAEIVPGQVLFDRQAQLAPGETLILKVAARAEQEGNHKFRAVLEAVDPETKLIAEEMTRFFKAGTLQGIR